MKLRSAEPSDMPFLWQCLAIAAREPTAAAAEATPIAAKYLNGWPRPGDFGIIAEQNGRPAGAAWARLFAPSEHPFVHVDARTPEIATAVLPECRGRGLGGHLLTALAEQARPTCNGLCLNVRADNPAVRLYERQGYRHLPGSELVNRTGGLSFGMVLRFR